MHRSLRARPSAILTVVAWLAVAVAGPVVVAAAGPPFPEPQVDRSVYDTAGVLSGATIASAEQTIDAIEERTGAEIVVYTQVVDYGITESEAEQHAIALMDQWGVGRKGFDDGLVILYDLDPSLEHGQVQLYAGPGFRATFMTNEERQAIFEDDMLPLLREADLDGALLIALERVNGYATPEHAARLQGARQLDAVLGLVGAPILFMAIAGWGVLAWRRYGRDPVYLDSPSIHLPAPPADLTAAAGATVREGKVTRRALTAALLDLASRGQIAFREEKGLLGIGTKVGVETAVPEADPVTEAHRARNGRRPTSKAEQYALSRLRSLGKDGYLEPDELLKFGTSVDTFNTRLESHVVRQGWFEEAPGKVVTRWAGRGTLAVIGGIVLAIIGFNLPSNGVLLLGVGAFLGGLVLLAIARAMPSVTLQGAMIRAMLAAYRRTLEKTMAQARSMQQVVDEAGLDWLDTPDQAVVWGLALGLEDKVEAVLERTLDDVRAGRADVASAYVPSWYHGGSSGSGSGGASSGGPSGLFSSGALPNFGGMMGALGTIGDAPSSSGSGGGGGFSGGSSGGGGGGAGGGF